MNLGEFDYFLPSELIARYPLSKRSSSRLLCLNAKNGRLEHRSFKDLVSLLRPNDLLVCNNSKVIPARLLGNKESGGKIEVLIERILSPKQALAHIRASKSPAPGSYFFAKAPHCEPVKLKITARRDNLFELESAENLSILEILKQIGQVPLPPYLQRAAELSDQDRYQTIFAEHEGSVAAPTAGLHFDEEIMHLLQENNIKVEFITLHVGAGTFAPVRVEDITQHTMHAEYVEVSAKLCEQIANTKQQGGRIIAVGTTAVRAIETAAQEKLQPYQGDTRIFIYPGFQFKCVDGMITNFHLPKSTLLMLISAFAGIEPVMNAYQTAVKEKYRFFSYGDAMFLY